MAKKKKDAIETCPDTAIRDNVIAGLQTVTQLTHPRASAAMFQAAMSDAKQKSGGGGTVGID